MTTSNASHFRRTRFLPLLAAVAIAACGPSTGDLGSVAPRPSAAAPSIEAPSAEPTPGSTPSTSPGASPQASPADTTTVRAYFFLGSFTDNSGLVAVLRQVPHTTAVGAAAMHALLAGPNDAELGARPAMYTLVPEGTRILGLTIESGVATVDLSREFEAGGDATSTHGRLAQAVYTLTQFPTITSVRFTFDGVLPKTVFTGSYGRADFTGLLPAIWVDRPAWGGVLGNPGRVTGLANVFEAQFRMQVLDASGHSLTDQSAMASCGTGCWGTFDVTLRYTLGSAQWGTLRVYDLSAKDGSRQHLVDYPVWLTPAS